MNSNQSNSVGQDEKSSGAFIVIEKAQIAVESIPSESLTSDLPLSTTNFKTIENLIALTCRYRIDRRGNRALQKIRAKDAGISFRHSLFEAIYVPGE